MASVLTSGSLDVQNGRQCAKGSGPVTEVSLDPKEKTSTSTALGALQPCPVKAAVTIRQDALSIIGKKPDVGGTSMPASQETSKTGGFRQPITVKTGVPMLCSRPIRLKIVVPPRCKRPITNSAICLTKDFARSHFRGPDSVSSRAVITGKNRRKIHVSAVKNEGEVKEVNSEKTEFVKHESFHEIEAERWEKMCNERDVLSAKNHTDELVNPFISSPNTVKILSQQGIKEETAERKMDENIPLVFQETDLQPCKTFDEVGMEEQTEPLDLSLPKKRGSRERRCGRFLDDSGCDSLLIMEVDEYEGDGDRDIVEEDDEGDEEHSVLHMDGADTLEDSSLSPSFFSTSVFTSLSLIEGDTENLLLIDDQGIPYTLSPEGLKVPQVDASMSEDPLSDQNNPAKVEGRRSASLAVPNLSQSLDKALNAPSDDLNSSPAPVTDPPSVVVDQTKTPEVVTSLTTNSDPSKAAEPSVQSVLANAVLSPPSGIAVPTQPIQIFTNPSTNAPMLLLSSSSSSPQLSSAPMGLTLPLAVTQTAPSSSPPMFLLLSSGDSASTSTPIAVLDPSTGKLSQITAASTPISLPLPSGQVGSLGSPPPTMSHPIIRLSPNNPPVILPGVNNVTSGSVVTSLTAGSSSPALKNDDQNSMASLLHSQINSFESNSGSKAIVEAEAEEVSNENNKPLTSTASSSRLQSASMTFDPLVQPSSEAQSPASEPQFDSSDLHTQHLPLDDHLYFSNPAVSPSPPIAPILSSGKLKPLDPLDPLDPLSPVASPNTMGPRRVLYCQLCPRVFFYLSDLERHAITHSQKKPHVCQQCGKAFKRSSHLQVSASSL